MDSSRQLPDSEMISTPSAYLGQSGMYITLPEEMEGFILGTILGSGSIGKVYKATQTKEYAVKVIQWNTNSAREVAKHEYETGQLFKSCDETLHSLSYYEQEHQSFIVMEYGVPCLSYYSGRECSMREILNTILRVSKALETIHFQGYTHFDVKPDNILMVKGEAKLGDFSHCSRFMCGQIYNRPMGTGIYMAPEIVVGGKFTGKEDMYSLGISMYVLLMAGRLPFDFTGRESKKREQNDKIESLFIHPELLNIIQRAAAFDACDRYESFRDFSNDLQTFVDLHNEKVDEEMPLYRIHPSLQQTVFPSSSHFTWSNLGNDNESKSISSLDMRS